MLLLFSHYVMSDSLWPNGLQHTRLLCPTLSPGLCSNSCPLSWWCYLKTLMLGKIEGKMRRGWQRMRWLESITDLRAQSLQSCPTLCDPMDHGPPGSSVHGILQAKILEWVAVSFSYHWLNGHEFEQTLGDSGGQRSLVCCSPLDHKESDTT